jgi:hypothetical protein
LRGRVGVRGTVTFDWNAGTFEDGGDEIRLGEGADE